MRRTILLFAASLPAALPAAASSIEDWRRPVRLVYFASEEITIVRARTYEVVYSGLIAEVLSNTPFGVIFPMVALVRNGTTLPIDSTSSRSTASCATVAISCSSLTLRWRTRTNGPQRERRRDQVNSGNLGVRDLTRLDGLFVVPVLAKPAAPFSLIARTAQLGDDAPAAVYDRLIARWKLAANDWTKVAPIPYANRIGGDPMTAIQSRTVYDKGPYLLYKLHKEIGDDQFLTFLSRIRNRAAGSSAAPPKWRACCSSSRRRTTCRSSKNATGERRCRIDGNGRRDATRSAGGDAGVPGSRL